MQYTKIQLSQYSHSKLYTRVDIILIKTFLISNMRATSTPTPSRQDEAPKSIYYIKSIKDTLVKQDFIKSNNFMVSLSIITALAR